jgi:uncharacterized protein (DUF58 family)
LTKFLDPEILARIGPIGLRAKTLVEGLVAGQHRSPLRGQSLEFSQHREYVPGDDLRQVDWKVFARSDKYYVRQYEDETNLTAFMLIDRSPSMQYQSPPARLSKLQTAQTIACSLGYMVIAQHDSIGLATFAADIDNWLAPSSSPALLDDMSEILEPSIGSGSVPSLGSKLRPNRESNALAEGFHSSEGFISRTLCSCLHRLKRPTLLILISDLLDNPDCFLPSIRLVRSAGHDLLVIHILDPWEIDFPIEGIAEFVDLEGEQNRLTVDPRLIGADYKRAMTAFCKSIQSACECSRCDYFLIRTDQPLAVSLPSVLYQRQVRWWQDG